MRRDLSRRNSTFKWEGSFLVGRENPSGKRASFLKRLFYLFLFEGFTSNPTAANLVNKFMS